MGLAELDHRRHSELADRLWAELKTRQIVICEDCDGNGSLPLLDEDMDVEEMDLLRPTRTRECHCRRNALVTLGLFEAGLPNEFWQADEIKPELNIENYDSLRLYAENIRRAKRHGLSLLLTGERGTGKTSSAAIALIAAVQQKMSAAYISFPDLIQGMRRAWRDERHGRYLDDRCTRDFVVVDELGKEHTGKDSDFVLSKLDSLVRTRRGLMQPTILITNDPPLELFRRYGASFESLLADRYKLMAYAPGDYRVRTASRDTWLEKLTGDSTK